MGSHNFGEVLIEIVTDFFKVTFTGTCLWANTYQRITLPASMAFAPHSELFP